MTVVESVGWVLVHFLWQGAAIAALLRMVLALTEPSRPALRYALGCGALALMLAAPLATAARLAQAGATPLDAGTPALTLKARDPIPAYGAMGAFAGAAAQPADPRRSGAHPSDARRSDAPTSWVGTSGVRLSDPRHAETSAASAESATRAGTSDRQNGSTRLAGWSLPPSVRARVTAMLPWLVGAWSIGVMLLSVRLAGGWWRTRALRTRGIEAVPDACQRMGTRLMARMRITRPVAFFVSSRVTAPIVFGHVKPVVLVPAAALAGLSPSQLDAILAHELAHVRRHDYLVNLLQTVIETIFFYHPAVWWVSRQVRQSREECCDDIAVAACGDRKDYVEALLGLEQMRYAAATIALGATDGSLLARARRLLLDTEREGTSPRLTASAIAVAVAGVAMAGISMAATQPVEVERPFSSMASLRSVGSASASSASTPSRFPPSSGESLEAGGLATGEQASQAAREPQQPPQPPQPVIAAPDPSAPFAARRAWVEREAKQRRASQYWFGYSIRPVKGLHPMVYFDRKTTVVGKGVQLSGHFFSDRVDGFRFQGQPLAIADADPSAIKVLFLLEARDGSPRLSRVHASTQPLPFDANDRPIFWIGAADTPSSLAFIDTFYAAASTQELKKDLVSTVGIHDDSPAVVAWLERRVKGSDSDEVRAEAVQDLAWHPIPAALAELERAARQDRASRVRREAAEALGDLKMPEAAPVLIALAKSLGDRDARREAIEALGERPEMAARDALGSIARDDASVEMQREAVETLGDFRDGRGVAILRELLRTHPSQDVRREVIETLADNAPPADAMAMLRDVMQRDTDDGVRREAVERLADIDDEAARKSLIEIARTHESEDLRAEATESLADVKPSAEMVPVLKQIAMTERTLHVRSEAVEALFDLPDGQGIDALVEIARDHTDHETRKKALEALTESEHPKARAILLRMLQKPSGE